MLSYARKWEAVGNDLETAVKALDRKGGELVTVANGGTVGPEQDATVQTTVRGTLRAALEVAPRSHRSNWFDLKLGLRFPKYHCRSARRVEIAFWSSVSLWFLLPLQKK